MQLLSFPSINSLIPLLPHSEFSSSHLYSVAVQPGLYWTWPETQIFLVFSYKRSLYLQSEIPVFESLSHQVLMFLPNHTLRHVGQFLTIVEPSFHRVPIVLENFLVPTSCHGFLETSQVDGFSCVHQPGLEGAKK